MCQRAAGTVRGAGVAPRGRDGRTIPRGTRRALARAVFSRNWGYLAVGLAAAACGSKSGLFESGATSAAGGGAGSGGASSGGAGSGGAGNAGGSEDAGADAPPPLPDCTYVLHGEPIVLFTYGDGVRSPMLARLSAGSPGVAARVAFGLIHEHFWHPDIRVADVSVGPAWPEGVSVTHPMTLYGIDAHSGGQLIPAADGGLALFYYHADEASPNVTPGLMFRRFDTAAWKPLPEVFVEKKADYGFSISPGPVASQKGASGQGYVVSYRGPVETDGAYITSTSVRMIDTEGATVSSPAAVDSPGPYPGTGATSVFGGSTHLVVSNARPCPGDAPECAPRLTVASLGKLGLSTTATVPPNPNRRARTPLVRAHDGNVWVVWREQLLGAKPETDPPSTVRLVAIDASGQVATVPWQVDAHPDAGADLSVSDQGVLIAWGERVDPKLPPQTVGHSRLRLRQFGKAGQELQELTVPTTELTGGSAYSVLTLSEPRALLVAWTARSEKAAGKTEAYLARFDCAAP